MGKRSDVCLWRALLIVATAQKIKASTIYVLIVVLNWKDSRKQDYLEYDVICCVVNNLLIFIVYFLRLFFNTLYLAWPITAPEYLYMLICVTLVFSLVLICWNWFTYIYLLRTKVTHWYFVGLLGLAPYRNCRHAHFVNQP